MKIKDLKKILEQYPNNMDIKLLVKSYDGKNKIIPFTDENMMETSKTAFINDEKGYKFEFGKGKHYLLFNPIIT